MFNIVLLQTVGKLNKIVLNFNLKSNSVVFEIQYLSNVTLNDTLNNGTKKKNLKARRSWYMDQNCTAGFLRHCLPFLLHL